MSDTDSRRSAIRAALVEFLDWEELYDYEGWGSVEDANRDYDRLTDKIVDALDDVERS